MYPKVSFSAVPMSREEIAIAKKALASRHLDFLR